MDIYLTGHLVLAFGIFAKIYQSIHHSNHINQINLYIFIIRAIFCPRSETKTPPKKSPRFSCPIFFVRPAPNCYTNTRDETNKQVMGDLHPRPEESPPLVSAKPSRVYTRVSAVSWIEHSPYLLHQQEQEQQEQQERDQRERQSGCRSHSYSSDTSPSSPRLHGLGYVFFFFFILSSALVSEHLSSGRRRTTTIADIFSSSSPSTSQIALSYRWRIRLGSLLRE